MSTGTGGVERALQQLLVPTCVASGAVVAAGFFFPSLVGSAVDGQGWLLISLLFFGSGLGYLTVLPTGSEEGTDAATYLLRLRQKTLRTAVREFLARHDPMIFGVPVATFAAFFLVQFAAPAATVAAVNAVRDVLLRDVGLLFLGAMLLAVWYCGFLLVGPWGEIRLGGPDAEPAYTYPTYFTLVFTAGIAAGIVFWGPAEALFHYGEPPPYFDAAPASGAATTPALAYALFHWGFSAWSAYAVIGIPIAYFVFQRGAPLRVSSILTPFLGVDGLDSVVGRLVDTLAVFATIGGIATSLALVSRQFLTGVGFNWGVTSGSSGPLLFLGGLTLVYVLSATTGIHRGIRRIAGVNVALFALFGVLLVAVGPRSFVASQATTATAAYLGNFVPMSLFTSGEWVANWTVWNWSWWFSWAPFAGLFLAALSRGRRIRTVVLTGVVATAAATMAWFLLMGGTSLYVQRTGGADVLGAIAARGGAEAVAGFPVLTALPLGELLLFFFLALIVVFATSSADTSTLVVAVLSSRREQAPTPGSIAFWGAFQGAVAVSVLLVGGGETLQAMAVLTGGPFAVLSIVALAGLTRTFRRHEGGHTSPLVRLWRWLPAIRAHHDVDPPEK